MAPHYLGQILVNPAVMLHRKLPPISELSLTFHCLFPNGEAVNRAKIPGVARLPLSPNRVCPVLIQFSPSTRLKKPPEKHAPETLSAECVSSREEKCLAFDDPRGWQATQP